MCINKTVVQNQNRDGTNTFKCGKCYQCINLYVNDWAIRCYYQSLTLDQGCDNYFVTLTLDEDHVHTMPDTRECQLFFKLLRKNFRNSSFKYILVSEYGEKKDRLHYHMLLFNFPMSSKEFRYREIGEFMQRAWKKGYVDVRPFEIGRVSYVLRYQFKDRFTDGLDHIRLFSKGIGKEIPTNLINYYNSLVDFTMCTIRGENNVNTSLPRYYRKLYFDVDTCARFSKYWYDQNLTSNDDDNLNKMFNYARTNNKFFKNEKV